LTENEVPLGEPYQATEKVERHGTRTHLWR